MTLSLTVPAYGLGYGTGTYNATAPVFSRRDAAPAGEFATPAAKTGGHAEWLYRVITSVTAANGDILIFAEAHERDNDAGCNQLVMKRSTDGCISYLAPIVVYQLTTYSYGSDFINSPCPFVLADGTVVCVFIRREPTTDAHRLYYVTSSDHGYTWSAATEITTCGLNSTRYSGNITSITSSGGFALVTCSAAHGLTDNLSYRVTIAGSNVGGYNGSSKPSSRAVGNIPSSTTILLDAAYISDAGAAGTWTLVANWHVPTDEGIRLRGAAHAGRIVIPCDHRYSMAAPGGSNAGISFSHWIATDALTLGTLAGSFYVLGRLGEGTLASPTTANDNSNETSVCELSGGSLFSLIRIQDGSTLAKGYSISQDYGATWDNMLVADGASGRPAIPGTASDGGLLSTTDFSIFMSWPADTATRAGVSVGKLSINEGTKAVTVLGTKVLHQFRSGYSTLCEVDANTIMCAFERTNDDTYYTNIWYEEIAHVLIPKAFVIDSVTAPTNPQVIDFWFNDAASGAVAASGTPVRSRGDIDQRGVGQTAGNASYDGDNGMLIAGAAADPPVILCRNIGSRSLAPFLLPGLGSIVYEVEFRVPSSTSARCIIDSSNTAGAAGTNGVYLGIANLGHRVRCNISDGTTLLGIVTTNGAVQDDNAWHVVRIHYVRGGTNLYYLDGVQLTLTGGGTDTLNSAVSIRGTTAVTLGRLSGSSTAPFGLTAGSLQGNIRRIRITKGPTVTTPITAGETKPSYETYLGTPATSAPANAPSATNRIFWLGARWDGGRTSRIDALGYNPPKMPAVHGQGFTSMYDTTGTYKFRPISYLTDDGFGAEWWEIDSIGRYIRHVPAAGAGGSARFQVDTVTTAFDVPQNTGLFTFLMAVKPISAIGTAATFFDNIGGDIANAGVRFYRTSGNKVGFVNSAGSSTVWCNLTSGFTNSPTLDNGWWLFAVRGNVTTVQLSYAQALAGRVGAWTHLATQAMTDRTGTHASTGKLTIGSNTDGSAQCDLGWFDLIPYSAVLSDATIEAWGRYVSSSLPINSPRYGYGFGYGY